MNAYSRASKSSLNELIAFESGKLSDAETIGLFQRLIDDGSVWRLQGFYGRTARDLIEAGLCMLGPVQHRDYYGNTVSSRDDVAAGNPGSQEFVDRTRRM